jgi:GT2 family glycosyltransferase
VVARARTTRAVLRQSDHRSDERRFRTWQFTAAGGDQTEDRRQNSTQTGRPALSSVDIILINWNSREDTLHALESIASQVATTPEAGVIVVDNGSTDGSVEAIRSRWNNVRVAVHERNRGFTGGIRSGVAASNADYVVFLNNDAIAEPGWLAALVAAIEASSADVISVAGKIIDPSGTRVDFIEGIMTFDGHAFQRDFRRRIDEAHEPARGAELLFACGGNMIVRREAFLQLGGFDDDYFAYLEDVDFGWRAWLSGHRVIYEPGAVVRHKSSATSDRIGNFERGVLFVRNAIQTMIKNAEEGLFAQLLAPAFLAMLHRLHRYTLDRNGDTAALKREPFSEGGDAQRSGLMHRLRRKFSRAGRAQIEDPLTMMQFRATEWLFRNSERLMARRATVQAVRKRSDREIFAKFPLHYIPTYHGDEALMSSHLFRTLRSELPSVECKLEDMIRT